MSSAQDCGYHTRFVFRSGERASGTMAGHSSWANIQRRESVQARLRDKAIAARAASGLQSVRYEGYGPGGAAVMLECLTDDRRRLAAQLRRIFVQHGGHLGADGAVSYLFNTVGLMAFPPGTDEEGLMQVALEAGAEDVLANADRSVEVLADPIELDSVRALLTDRGFAPVSAGVIHRAATALQLSGETAERMVRLLEALEGLDEVRDVYSNVEISDEVLARV
jgi:YebC/PmpR family DNA-binding regulatory protein